MPRSSKNKGEQPVAQGPATNATWRELHSSLSEVLHAAEKGDSEALAAAKASLGVALVNWDIEGSLHQSVAAMSTPVKFVKGLDQNHKDWLRGVAKAIEEELKSPGSHPNIQADAEAKYVALQDLSGKQ